MEQGTDENMTCVDGIYSAVLDAVDAWLAWRFASDIGNGIIGRHFLDSDASGLRST